MHEHEQHIHYPIWFVFSMYNISALKAILSWIDQHPGFVIPSAFLQAAYKLRSFGRRIEMDLKIISFECNAIASFFLTDTSVYIRFEMCDCSKEVPFQFIQELL